MSSKFRIPKIQLEVHKTFTVHIHEAYACMTARGIIRNNDRSRRV